LESNSNLVKLKVLDHGLGIDEKDQGRVFELFERVSVSSAKGLGVGLYIVQQIVEAHGGKITLVSEKGSGSCFLVEFPIRSLSKVNYSQAPLNC
jgi:signal transduction histidine kinase